MCVFPSDQYIGDTEAFQNALQKAIVLAEHEDKLITLGIDPTFPSTGYGYINYDKNHNHQGAYHVKSFVEKPDLIKATQFIESGAYLWNSGIFVWKISAIIKSFERYLPKVYSQLVKWDEYIGTPSEQEMLAKIYLDIQSISIDVVILERSDDVLVVPADMGWSDIGSWDALGTIFLPDEHGNIIKSDESVMLNSNNNIIFSEDQLISATDINDTIIISTTDALLIYPKSRTQDVKPIVEELTARNMEEYLYSKKRRTIYEEKQLTDKQTYFCSI